MLTGLAMDGGLQPVPVVFRHVGFFYICSSGAGDIT